MATHSSVLAWRILGMGEPGGLPSMGSHRVGHNWSDLAAAASYHSSARNPQGCPTSPRVKPVPSSGLRGCVRSRPPNPFPSVVFPPLSCLLCSSNTGLLLAMTWHWLLTLLEHSHPRNPQGWLTHVHVKLRYSLWSLLWASSLELPSAPLPLWIPNSSYPSVFMFSSNPHHSLI